MSENTTTRRKVLVPLATLLVAGAVAVGSGADFTSSSAHSVAVTSGTLHHTNSRNGAALTISNIKPGDSKTGTLTITNDGSIDSTLSLEQSTWSSTFVAPGDLKLTIEKSGSSTPLYDGNFGGVTGQLDLGALNVGDTTTVTYTVTMPSTAGNNEQGKSASASFQYVSHQAGDKSSTSWLP